MKGKTGKRGKGKMVKRLKTKINLRLKKQKNSLFPFFPFLRRFACRNLPLIHLHSLVVLFIVGVSVLILKPEKWREWIAFGVGVAIIAIPELVWAMTGSASNIKEFFAFHFGWDAGDENFSGSG